MNKNGRLNTWTKERLDLAAKLWNEGYSAAQVAKQIGGVTRNAVVAKRDRLRKAGDPRITRPMFAGPLIAETPWQQKEADQQSLYILQRHEWDGAPLTVIANELGASSKSVRAEYSAVVTELNQSEAA